MLRKLSFSGPSKFQQKSIVVHKNEQGLYGFTLRGGLESNTLPIVSINGEVNAIKGRLRDGAEVLEINGRVVGGEKLAQLIELGRSDTIELSIVDPTAPLAKRSLTQILQSQKSSGKTSDYIEHIRCNVYDATKPVTTRPPKKEDYMFVTRKEFAKLIADNQMIEWGENDTNGHLYGTCLPQEKDDVAPGSVKLVKKSVGLSGSNASIAPLVLQFNIVVLSRPSFNASWGFSLGLCADGALPIVTEVLPSVNHIAWLSGPIKKDCAILAVNGTSVVCASTSTVAALLNKHCSAQLTVVSEATGRALTCSALLRAPATTPDLLHAQADIRFAVHTCAAQVTTLPRLAAEPAAAMTHVSEVEFAAQAATSRMLSWLVADDGHHYGVALPLAPTAFIPHASKLTRELKARLAQPFEIELPSRVPSIALDKRLGRPVVSPQVARDALASPTASLPLGALVLTADGTVLTSPRADTYASRATVKYAWDMIANAYSLPEPPAAAPGIFPLYILFIAVFVALISALVQLVLSASDFS